MIDFLTYQLEVAYTMLLFGLVYAIFLRKQTHFRWSRIYLWGALLVAHLIPIIKIPAFSHEVSVDFVRLPEVVITFGKETAEVNYTPWWLVLISVIYILVSAFLLLRFLGALWHFRGLSKSGTAVEQEEHDFHIVLHPKVQTPFSFFSYCFLPAYEKESKEDQAIVAHEAAHIHLRHSLDVVLLEVLQSLAWINPVLWVYSSWMKACHEFQADQRSAGVCGDPIFYQRLLLRFAQRKPEMRLANSFKVSSIRNRILMLGKAPTPSYGVLTYLLFVPLSLMLLFAFSEKKLHESVVDSRARVIAIPDVFKVEKTEKKTFTAKDLFVEKEKPIFTVVEKNPQFPGGMRALTEFLGSNIKYPESAKNDGIQGRVFYNFVVNEDGTISDIKVLRGINKEIDEEGMRVIQSMPKWKPGIQRGKAVRVSFNLPIKWSLS